MVRFRLLPNTVLLNADFSPLITLKKRPQIIDSFSFNISLIIQSTFDQKKLSELFLIRKYWWWWKGRSKGRNRLFTVYFQPVNIMNFAISNKSKNMLELRSSTRWSKVWFVIIIKILKYNRDYIVTNVSLSFKLINK